MAELAKSRLTKMDKFFKLQKVPQEIKKKEIKWSLSNFVNLDAM